MRQSGVLLCKDGGQGGVISLTACKVAFREGLGLHLPAKGKKAANE